MPHTEEKKENDDTLIVISALRRILPQHCGPEEFEFVKCKNSSLEAKKDPYICLKPAKIYARCSAELVHFTQRECSPQLNADIGCLKANPLNFHTKCKKTQKALNTCYTEKAKPRGTSEQHIKIEDDNAEHEEHEGH